MGAVVNDLGREGLLAVCHHDVDARFLYMSGNAVAEHFHDRGAGRSGADDLSLALHGHIQFHRCAQLVVADAQRDMPLLADLRFHKAPAALRVADGCEEKGLIRILQRQHLPQDVGVPTGGAAGDVVAGIGDEDGTLLLGHRHLQRLVRFGGQAGIVELMALVPHIGRHLVGDLLRILLICRRLGYGHDAAARHRGIVAI